MACCGYLGSHLVGLVDGGIAGQIGAEAPQTQTVAVKRCRQREQNRLLLNCVRDVRAGSDAHAAAFADADLLITRDEGDACQLRRFSALQALKRSGIHFRSPSWSQRSKLERPRVLRSNVQRLSCSCAHSTCVLARLFFCKCALHVSQSCPGCNTAD